MDTITLRDVVKEAKTLGYEDTYLIIRQNTVTEKYTVECKVLTGKNWQDATHRASLSSISHDTLQLAINLACSIAHYSLVSTPRE